MSTHHEVIRIVSEATKIPASDILGKLRVRPIADARLAVYVGLRRRGLGVVEIGHMVGGRTNSTVSKGIQAAYRAAATDPKFRKLLEVAR